jgi:hypothetical protein
MAVFTAFMGLAVPGDPLLFLRKSIQEMWLAKSTSATPINVRLSRIDIVFSIATSSDLG